MPILVSVSVSLGLAAILAILWGLRVTRAKAVATPASGSAVVDTAEIESLTEIELQRARRLNYQLSLIVLRLGKGRWHNPSPDEVIALIDATSPSGSAGKPASGAVTTFGTSRAPIVKLRSTDNVVFDRQQERFVMMLVGTAREHAETIASRTAASLQEKLHCPCSVGCAAFPTDGFFAQDLLKQADPQLPSVLTPEEDKAAGVAY